MSTLTGAVSAFCRREKIDLKGKTVLVALSGGRDSVALFSILLELGVKEGFAVAAAHYNHHLRKTAGRDEDFVRELCAKRGVPLALGGGDVAAFAREMSISIEDAARTLRYRFLEETAEEMGADFIATAHHAGDNAETVLMNLLRGTGLRGLSGIPPVRGKIIRPLLEVVREDIDRYIEENALPYVEDETNAETVYTRNRLRHELLPLLEELSPGSTERVAAAAARLRQDSAYLERQAEEKLPPADDAGETRIPLALLGGEDPAIAARLVRLAARRLAVELTAPQVEAVLSLKTGVAVLPEGLRAVREGKTVRFYRLSPPPPPARLSLGEQVWGQWRVTVRETEEKTQEDEHTLLLRADLPELTIASWDGTGRLAVENGRRTVKRLHADHGIGVSVRETMPAIFAGDTLAAVFGAGTDWTFAPQRGKKLVITLGKRG